jgi:hypothetical protein
MGRPLGAGIPGIKAGRTGSTDIRAVPVALMMNRLTVRPEPYLTSTFVFNEDMMVMASKISASAPETQNRVSHPEISVNGRAEQLSLSATKGAQGFMQS